MSEKLSEWIDVGLPTYGSGLLGACGRTPAEAEGMRLITIERRIIRIEMALRRAGIEVESIPFPGDHP
ncbi:hypothetical protein [Sphingobium chungbukense]|uniref:Uncharacterized protein n=1 Tax=Sphingobium chungbukense TaxID=56193 RepID=A0A0M3AUM8_9SPHN|nr:hypothetical protein [Sphingobium chungbukense]KKW92636.1 hypothetical protein YP76_06785 [Sphingobium chungbukense]